MSGHSSTSHGFEDENKSTKENELSLTHIIIACGWFIYLDYFFFFLVSFLFRFEFSFLESEKIRTTIDNATYLTQAHMRT